MSDQPLQTYATHRRWDPWYHVVAAILLLGLVAHAVVQVWKHHDLASLWQLGLVALLMIMTFKLRSYPLKAQDRLIRLEETLRMERLLPADLKARIPELHPDQFVGLRFAADAELADRVREALGENLDSEAIKKRIKTWRPDTFRV